MLDYTARSRIARPAAVPGRPAGPVGALESLGASAYLVAAAIGLASLLGVDVIAMSWPSNVVVAERETGGKRRFRG